jgi:hypothetical protein
MQRCERWQERALMIFPAGLPIFPLVMKKGFSIPFFHVFLSAKRVVYGNNDFTKQQYSIEY